MVESLSQSAGRKLKFNGLTVLLCHKWSETGLLSIKTEYVSLWPYVWTIEHLRKSKIRIPLQNSQRQEAFKKSAIKLSVEGSHPPVPICPKHPVHDCIKGPSHKPTCRNPAKCLRSAPKKHASMPPPPHSTGVSRTLSTPSGCKIVNHFRKKAPSWLFDWTLNTHLHTMYRFKVGEN